MTDLILGTAIVMGVAGGFGVLLGLVERLIRPSAEMRKARKTALEDCTALERAFVRRGFCPDCHGNCFLCGPRSGERVNLRCANERCGAEFHVGPLACERLTTPSPRKVKP